MPGNKSRLEKLLSLNRLAIGENVYARALWIQNKKRWELAIIVDDDTTAEQLRASWQNINRLRDQLRENQGTDLSDTVKYMRVQKAARLLQGMSYAEVALETNHDVLVNLCRAHWCLEKGEAKEALDSIAAAQVHLRALRMKPEEIADWTWSALDDIRDGRAPWSLKDGPASKERVRANLRQLERELQSGTLIFKHAPPSRVKPASSFVELPVNKEPRELADRLLEKMVDGGGKQQLSDAIKRHMSRKNSGGVENTG